MRNITETNCEVIGFTHWSRTNRNWTEIVIDDGREEIECAIVMEFSHN